MCLHIIYITSDVTINKIIAVTNRKISMVYLLKKEFLLAKSKPLLCLFANQNFHFYAVAGEQSILKLLVLLVNQK